MTRSCLSFSRHSITTIDFLTCLGKICTPRAIRPEFIVLTDVLGVSAVVDTLNNSPSLNRDGRSILGPFNTNDVPNGRFDPAPSPSLQLYFCLLCAVTSKALGESIASEGNNGEYM
jgi:hypothetical protein